MNISVELKGKTAVLTMRGRLVVLPDAVSFFDHLTNLADSGTSQVVVDFSHVRFTCAAMLGMLTDGLELLQEIGGDLRLVGVSQPMRKILDIAQLSDTFQIWDSVDWALHSFTLGLKLSNRPSDLPAVASAPKLEAVLA